MLLGAGSFSHNAEGDSVSRTSRMSEKGMFDWLPPLLKNFDIPTPIAWMATIFGGSFLVLIRMGIWPFANGEVVSAPIAGAILLFGMVVLLVHGISWGMDTFSAHRQGKISESLEKAERQRRAEDVIANWDAMTQLERNQMFWILRKGKRRVDQPIEHSLIEKGFLHPVKRYNFHLVDVDEWVWENRERFISQERRAGISPEFPVQGWMGR